MRKIIKDMDKRALRWSDIEGAEKLKSDFYKFNFCRNIILENSFDGVVFCFSDTLIRNDFNTKDSNLLFYTHTDEGKTIPDELYHWYDELIHNMESFIKKGFQLSFVSEKRHPNYDKFKTINENNEQLKRSGFATYDDQFIEVIDINDTINGNLYLFEVSYLYVDNNQYPYLSISLFDGCKTFLGEDSSLFCDHTFSRYTIIKAFIDKWKYHVGTTITTEEYEEIKKDINLIKKYGPLHLNNLIG